MTARKLQWIYVLGLTLLVVCTQTLTINADPLLHKAIQTALSKQQLTGAVWSTVVPDGTIKTACAGFRNYETKAYFKITDKVQVGSITKTLMGTGILRLATEGKLNLDSPVNNYLPDVLFNNPWHKTNPITIRHLLDHTSGLGDLQLWHLFSTSATANSKLSEFYRKDPSVLTIQAKPGTIYSYSNMGYTLLGMVIEAITNQQYEKYLDENLLKPLGMSNSTFRFVTQTGESADTSLAMGHLDKGEPYAAYPIFIRPAGQFTTTAYDMGLFMKFIMNGGVIEGKAFINKDYLCKLGKAHKTNAANHGLPLGHALGAYYRDKHSVTGLAHGGNIVGYRAMMYMFPEERKGFFIAHNMDSETADYEVFNKILIEHLGILPQSASFSKENTKQIVDWSGYYVPAITKVFPFGLVDYLSSFTKVQVNQQGATFATFQKEPVTLNYLGNHKFIAEGKVNPSHVFYKDELGKMYITTGLSTVTKTKAIYILLGWTSIIAGITGIAFLLFSWFFKLLTLKKESWKHPLVWHTAAVTVIVAASLLLLNGSFVSLGDITLGSLLLAGGTLLLPISTAISLYKYFCTGLTNLISKIDVLALIFVLQFSIVLFLNGLIPLMLWR